MGFNFLRSNFIASKENTGPTTKKLDKNPTKQTINHDRKACVQDELQRRRNSRLPECSEIIIAD